MCGLTGIWQPGGGREEILRTRVGAMARSLAHRGPDDGGDWVDAAGGVALGFRRLRHHRSVPDRPPADALGRRPLRHRLQRRDLQLPRVCASGWMRDGAVFRGHSDTEVMLELIARPACATRVPELSGMFAFALWDTQRARAVPGARPAGEEAALLRPCRRRRLAVRLGAEGLRAHPGCPVARSTATPSPRCLRYGYVPAPRSIYAGIASCRRATSCDWLRDGRAMPAVEPYWRARAVVEAGRRRTPRDRRRRGDRGTRSAAARRGRRRMIADVPLGAFLSGGIDSSTVVALMQAQSGRRCGPSRSASTSRPTTRPARAAAVAAHLGTDHTEPARHARRRAAPSSRACPRSTTSRSPTRRRSRRPSSRRWRAGT